MEVVSNCATTLPGARFCNPENKEMRTHAPRHFTVEVMMSNGDSFTISVTRSWSPQGADRFFNLVRLGFLNQQRFYRVVPGWVAQFGVNGNPAASAVYNYRKNVIGACLPPEPLRRGNIEGSVAFSAAPFAVNRTAELYINLKDNRKPLDALGYTVFGVIRASDMKAIHSIYDGYGELPAICKDNSSAHPVAPIRCNGPDEFRVYEEGNEYLETHFPRLTYIVSSQVVGSAGNHQNPRNLWPVEIILVATIFLILAAYAASKLRRNLDFDRSFRALGEEEVEQEAGGGGGEGGGRDGPTTRLKQPEHVEQVQLVAIGWAEST